MTDVVLIGYLRRKRCNQLFPILRCCRTLRTWSDSILAQSSRWKKLGRPLSIAEAAAAESAPAKEVDLKEALGGGIRKAPAVVAALDEAEVAEG
jgi:hypothetical protein